MICYTVHHKHHRYWEKRLAGVNKATYEKRTNDDKRW
jgi:hypothetical protein